MIRRSQKSLRGGNARVGGKSAILGGIDAIKLRSCCTLFEAAEGGADFARCLDTFYAGERDAQTLRLLV